MAGARSVRRTNPRAIRSTATAPRVAEALVERARELFSGGARRHQDEGVNGPSGIEIARQLDEELTIAGKIGGAEQPDATRSDHLVAGGSMTVS